MEKIQGTDELLRALGVNPETKATIAYAMWKPWERDDESHANDPQAFVGVYSGYKVAEKMLGNKLSVFDVLTFDGCTPQPSGGETGFAVGSSFMLEELKKVRPGTRIALVYEGSEKNPHGGRTNLMAWYFANPDDRATRVAPQALPPSNASQITAGARLIDDSSTVPANGSDGKEIRF